VRSIKTAAVLASLALVATACGGDGDATTTTVAITTLPPVTTTVATTSTSTTTTSTSSTTTTTLGPQNPSPLSGLEVEAPETLERRPIAVKIDNHPSARPQSGIQDADLMYELLVEGGLTRFIAVFHHSDSEYLGPIRSLRPTDSTLVTYLNAPLQISGGQDWIQSLARSRGLLMIGDDRVSTFRISSRKGPHNLYGITEKMRETADRRGWDNEAPEPIFNFGEPDAGATTASIVTLDWSNRPEVIWRFDPLSGTYLRSNRDDPHDWMSIDGDRSQIATDTLLVLTARRYTASPASGKGTPVPALDTIGDGQALLFYDGAVIEGTWARETYDDPFELALPSGDEMIVPRGKLWISIFPSTGSVDWQ
jgi:hypothetical protein